MNTKRSSKFSYIFFALLLLITVILGGRGIVPAYAATIKGSGALDDLQRDENFDPAAYPADVMNYKIDVIQIAESDEGELFIYTYQPCQSRHYLVATDVNMSLSEDFGENSDGVISGLSDSSDGSAGGVLGGVLDGIGDGSDGSEGSAGGNNSAVTQLYALELVNMSGVFGKYLVKDFTVNGDEDRRYYTITSILREYVPYLDGESGSTDTQTKTGYNIGKVFIAETSYDGKILYYEKTRETITITEKYVGNVMYEGGMSIGWGVVGQTNVNAMYVAFDTDRGIDKLYEADVQYSTQELQYRVKTNLLQFWNNYTVGSMYDIQTGDVVRQPPVTLASNKKGSTGAYSWQQIQTVDEFKSNLSKNGMELTTDAQTSLEGKKWVLNFATVDVEYKAPTVGSGWYPMGASWTDGFTREDPTVRTTLVSDVSVLRLKFEYKDQLYDLGAVDGAGTPSEKPDNRLPGYDENNENFSWGQWIKDKLGFSHGLPWWVWLIVALVALAILLPVLGFIFPVVGQVLLAIVKAIGKALLWLLKGLWWLICLPFKGIAALVKKIKEKRKSGTAKKSGAKKAKTKKSKKPKAKPKKNGGKSKAKA